MMLHKMGWFVQKVVYPKLTWARYSDEPKIHLTFDDGPIPEVTEWVLDTLATYDAKATFFCVGDNIRKHPAIFQRLLAEGHKAGNHTFNHLNGWNTPTQTYLENIHACAQYLPTESANLSKPLFRPPYGRIARAQWKALLPNYEIIMWDVLSGDFSPKILPKQCLSLSIKYTSPGSIIVFHDNIKAVPNLKYTLPRYLEHFSSKGWKFETL